MSPTVTSMPFSTSIPSFGLLNWDDECEELNAAAAFSENSFAAGLEQFGRLTGNWEDEFDDLYSSSDAVCTHSTSNDPCAAPEVDLSTKPDCIELFALDNGPGPVIATFPAMVTSSPIIVSSSAPITVGDELTQHNDVQQPAVEQPANASQAQTTILKIPAAKYFPDHPGWSPEESPSLSDDTSTSPEVCTWVMSSTIFQDIKWIMEANKHDQVNLDIPRVASCLNRAVYHLYHVPLDSSVRYPYKAWGEKDHYRSYGADVHFPRGAKGLKAAKDSDVPKEVYIPNGMKKAALRAKATSFGIAFYPEPSRLSQVETVSYEEEIEMLEAIENIKQIKKPLPFSFLSGENFLENLETENVDEIQGIPDEDVDIRIYDEDSESDAEAELSLTKKIEAQFEMEIDGSSLPSHIVDEDDEWFYNPGKESSGSCTLKKSFSKTSEHDAGEDDLENTGFDDFVLFDEDGKLSKTTYTHVKLSILDAHGVQHLIDDNFDHSDFAAGATQKLPQIPNGYRWTASSFTPVHHGPRLIVQADSGYNSAASDDDIDLYDHDDYTSEIDGDDIDEALARLESMGLDSIDELNQRNSESPKGITTKNIAATNDLDAPISIQDFASGNAGVDKPHNAICIVEGLGNALVSHVKGATSKTRKFGAEIHASSNGSPEQSSAPTFDGISGQPSETLYGIFDVVAAVGSTIMSLLSVNPFSVWLF